MIVYIIVLFLPTLFCHSEIAPNEDKQNDKNLYNRMVCENEKLVLSCNQNYVIKIERAYYGRYSITPCNKNHAKFTKGCTANDSMEIIQKLCEFKSNCQHKITTSLFRSDPCPGVDKVLEVNYKCINQKKGKYLADSMTKPTTVQEEEDFITMPTERVQCLSKFEYDNKPYEIKVDVDQLVFFPCTFHNDFYKQQDPKLIEGSHLYKCEPDGNLYRVNSTCRIKQPLIDNSKQEKNTLQVFNKLNEELNDDKQISIKNVINFLNNATKYITDENVSVSLVETIDNIIGKTYGWSQLNSDDKSKSITKLIDLVDNVLIKEDNLSVSSDNLVVQVIGNKDLQNRMEFPTEQYLQTKTDERVMLDIQNPHEDQKFLFVIYKNVNELFPTKIGTENETPSNRFINSNILSFKTNDDYLIDELKSYPIRLVFKHLIGENQEDFVFKPVCSYWKYDQSEYNGDWATDGCELEFTNKTHSICKCTHLTHFSILMDIYGVHKHQLSHHKLILSVLTIVLSIISCICIIFTLLAFRFITIIRRNREHSSTKDLTVITTHLCICLLTSLMLFLTGILTQQLGLRQFCSLIALMSHYSFLCSFFWMLLEGVQLYLMLVRIFILERSPINKFCLIAYGIPFIIVLVSKIIDYRLLESNGYGSQDHCWISNYKNFNLTFIIPISCILVANFGILSVVFYSMKNSMGIKQARVHCNKNQEDFFKSLLSFWCLISTLLGLPWILGYFIIDNEKTLIFSYLFTIINSSQGTIIFIFNCLISKNVREEIIKILRNQKIRLFSSLIGNESPSNTSTSSNYTSNLKNSSILSGDRNFHKKSFINFCLNSCYPLNPTYSDESSKKQTSNYLISPQYSSTGKQLQDLDENEPLNLAQPYYSRHSVRMLSSLPYMKRTSSLLSSSTMASNNPTQSTYVTPVILLSNSIPQSPPPPPPPQPGFSTFKTIPRRGNYDENQYLTPECHNYSAVDTDFNTETQFYMDNGLGFDEDYLDMTNNYDELVDNDLVYLRYSSKEKTSYIRALKLPNSSIGSSNSSSSSTNENSQTKLLSHTENSRAKKILQRPL